MAVMTRMVAWLSGMFFDDTYMESASSLGPAARLFDGTQFNVQRLRVRGHGRYSDR